MIVIKELGQHQVILSLDTLKKWQQVKEDFPHKMSGPWPQAAGVNYVAEEYEAQVTDEGRRKVIADHVRFIESRKWEEMSDEEITKELVTRFSDIFAEKLTRTRRLMCLQSNSSMKRIMKRSRTKYTWLVQVRRSPFSYMSARNFY